MDDPDTVIGPVEKAYARAETLVADDNAWTERRARVLAAIARSDPAPRVSAPRQARRSAFPRGGWLIAASVIGVSVFMATQLPQQTPIIPPAPALTGATSAGVAQT